MLNAGRLYHYTTLGALKFILPGRAALRAKGIEGKDTEFRFTQSNFLNDYEEGSIFISFLKERKKEIAQVLEKNYAIQDAIQKLEHYIHLCEEHKQHFENNRSDCFVFCASSLRDSSQFWLSPYAKSYNDDGTELDRDRKGICLSFDSYYVDRGLEDYMVTFDFPNERIDKRFVVYVNPYAKSLEKSVNNTFFELIKEEIKMNFNFTSRFTIKYAGWESEQEFRWMYWPKEEKIQYDSDAKHTPRTRLYLCGVIDEVILGPGFSQQDVDMVKNDLMSRGYGAISVELSKVKLQH